MGAPTGVVLPVGWNRTGVLRALFGLAGAVRPERGELTADATGLTVADGRGIGAFRWTWAEILELRIQESSASYLVVDATHRPRRATFALLNGADPMLPWDARAQLGRILDVAAAAGWKPSPEAPALELTDRSQRFAARTAQLKAENPDAYVVRTLATQSVQGRRAMSAGLAFSAGTRYGHLVADAAGLRMYQGADDLEWDKTWFEVVTLEETPDGRAIRLDATGWYAPKSYIPCEANGDQMLPASVSGVVRQLRERKAGRAVG